MFLIIPRPTSTGAPTERHETKKMTPMPPSLKRQNRRHPRHPHPKKNHSLKLISEAQIQVDGIHAERNGLEILLEYIAESPSKIGVDREMAERLPRAAYLCPVQETAEVGAEIIGRRLAVRKLHLLARRRTFPQIAVAHRAGEVAIHTIGHIHAGVGPSNCR